MSDRDNRLPAAYFGDVKRLMRSLRLGCFSVIILILLGIGAFFVIFRAPSQEMPPGAKLIFRSQYRLTGIALSPKADVLAVGLDRPAEGEAQTLLLLGPSGESQRLLTPGGRPIGFIEGWQGKNSVGLCYLKRAETKFGIGIQEVALRPGQARIGRGGLWVVPPDGLAVPFPEGSRFWAISPFGLRAWLAYRVGPELGGSSELGIIEFKNFGLGHPGSCWRKLTDTHGSNPIGTHLSPDGRLISYIGLKGRQHIMLYDLTTKRSRRIVPKCVSDQAWTPDGKRLLFLAVYRGHKYLLLNRWATKVREIDAASGGLIGSASDWLASRIDLMAVPHQDTTLMAYNLDRGVLEFGCRLPEVAPTVMTWLQIRPDGKTLYIAKKEGQVWKLPPAGIQFKPLAEVGGSYESLLNVMP